MNTTRENLLQALALAGLMLATVVHAADLEVRDVTFAQQSGGTAKVKKVNIKYSVSGDAPPYIISVLVSKDGGSTYDVPATSLKGDFGAVVTVGSKTITWDAGADWDKNHSANMKFKVKAEGFPGEWHYHQTDGSWLFDVEAVPVGSVYELRLVRWNGDVYQGTLTAGTVVSKLSFDASSKTFSGTHYEVTDGRFLSQTTLYCTDGKWLYDSGVPANQSLRR
jgi:hypothetical protein